jgi:exopolysaccharide biosynthesis polyprenyl glycosylphosphotransferase
VSAPPFPAVVDDAGWDGPKGALPGHAVAPIAGRLALAPSRRRGARQRVRHFSLAGDVVGVVLSCFLVVSAEPWLAPSSPDGRLRLLVLACPVIAAVLVAYGARTGARRRLAPRTTDLGTLVVGLAVAGVTLLAASSVGPLAAWLPPVEVGLALGTTVIVVPVARRGAFALAALDPDNTVRVVVVGAGALSDELCARLERSPVVTLVGVVDDEPAAGRPLLGGVEDLPRLCAAARVDRVVVAFTGRHPARCASVLQDLRGDVDIDVVVRYYELANWESRLSDLTGLFLLNIGRSPGRAAEVAKRGLDVLVAAAALAALAPVLAAVALAVRLESGAPVLFRQTRVGRDRRPFRILKFRTMRTRPEPVRSVTPRTPLENVADPSLVTPVGRFLRRTGLDELPQLVNVLRGEMALVGPRPFVPEECLGLTGAVARRFDVRPGITGMWQVCGQHAVGFEELCRLDVQYATSWSLRSDLRILARTPARLLRGSAPDR